MDFKKYEPITKDDCKLSSTEQANLMDQMRNEFLQASGLWDHPKADEMLARAWKNAYMYGPEEVFEHLDTAADMILDRPGDVKFNQ